MPPHGVKKNEPKTNTLTCMLATISLFSCITVLSTINEMFTTYTRKRRKKLNKHYVFANGQFLMMKFTYSKLLRTCRTSVDCNAKKFKCNYYKEIEDIEQVLPIQNFARPISSNYSEDVERVLTIMQRNLVQLLQGEDTTIFFFPPSSCFRNPTSMQSVWKTIRELCSSDFFKS